MSIEVTRDDTTVRRWTSLHCFLHWSRPNVDDFLTTAVRPIFDGARADGLLADWFFIRYWEGGPHLRLRARGLTDPDRVRARLAAAAADVARPAVDLPPAGSVPFAHGTVEEIEYRPETDRYGGIAALPVAERMFCRSTEVALDVLQSAPAAARMNVAVGLVYATALGLGLDDLATARWLRAAAGAWRWAAEVEMLPAAAVLSNATRTLSTHADALRERLATLRSDLDTRRGIEARWAREVAAAHQELAGPDTPPDLRWLIVWASQTHMLCNRLGLAPDEERALYWLISGALLGHADTGGYLTDSATAPDRIFLERSKLLPGLPGQWPSAEAEVAHATAGSAPARRWSGHQPTVELPARFVPELPLGQAIQRRRSARRLAGPVTATAIGGLLRTAFGRLGSRTVQRPDGTGLVLPLRGFPSAGGAYLTRLRLLVADVEGIPAGHYQVDPSGGRLRRLAELPTLAELAASSTWLRAGEDPTDPASDALDVTQIPAFLALSIDLDHARWRYGVRALRFGLLEAGHLAQNLALVAVAQGLAMVTIGGFYDDVLHELLGIDGVGEAVQYLIPLGREIGQ